jgi:hypothetical protein
LPIYNVPMPKSRASTVWKSIVIIGTGLLGIGLAAFSIDYVKVGEFDFIEKHYDMFGFAILIGSVCLLISLVGLATQLDKAGRARVATLALAMPVVILVVAGLSTGTNVHGVFPLFLFSMAPVMLSGLIVAAMAARTRA